MAAIVDQVFSHLQDELAEYLIPRQELSDLQLYTYGGMAEIYKAKHRGQPCAVKVLPISTATMQHIDLFVREFKILLKLQDAPRIVKPYGVCLHHSETDSAFWIVLEWVDGGNLRDLLTEHIGGVAGGHITEELALQLLVDVAEALAACHRAGIGHLDVKPENILLTADRRALLADFGIARAAAASSQGATSAASWAALSALQGAGTQAYMAPEQLAGVDAFAGGAPAERVTVAADVFAFALVAHELWTGALPSAGMPFYKYAAALLEMRQAPAINTIVPLLLRPLLESCVRVSAAERPRASFLHERLCALQRTGLQDRYVPTSLPSDSAWELEDTVRHLERVRFSAEVTLIVTYDGSRP
jgi:serine/threonine-protein kinase